MKTYKAISKRFRVTKKGKLMQKSTGLNHFRTKKTGNYKTAKRNKKQISKTYRKTLINAIG